MNSNNFGFSVNRDGSFDEEGEEASIQERVEDVPASPTWPIGGAAAPSAGPVPIGLNWQTVADAVRIDRRVLEHDGSIAVQGDYFIESGYFIDPLTLRGRHVDVGDRALRPGYFVSDLTVSHFRLTVPLEMAVEQSIVAPRPVSGPLVGVFADEAQAKRARNRLLDGSLAGRVVMANGPLGFELRVERAGLPGRVAGVIASHGGAVVSVDGRPVSEYEGPLVTNSSLTGGAGLDGQQGDARRAGTGVTGGSEGPEYTNRDTEVGHGEEFTSW